MAINTLLRLKDSFRAKLFAIFAFFIVVTSCSFTVFFIKHESNSYMEKLLFEGKLLADLLAYNSRLAVFAENKSMLQDNAYGILHHEHVMGVTISTADGRVLVAEGKSAKGKPSPQEIVTPRKNETTKVVPSGQKPLVIIDKADSIEFIVPVMPVITARTEESLFLPEKSSQTTQQPIGLVNIVLDKSDLNKRISNLVLTGILLATLFLMLGTIIAFYVLKGMINPLNRLMEGVVSLGKGERSKRVSVETHDEIGQLAVAFNNMVASLETREEEKRRLEEQLRHAQKMEAKEEWERTFDTVPDLVAILDREYRIVRVNRTMAQRLNRTKEEVIGATCNEFIRGAVTLPDSFSLPSGDVAFTAEVYEETLGSYFWITLTPLRKNDGTVTGSVYVARDITQRKIIEEEKKSIQAKLVQTNKMTSIGLLVSGLAHDVNNPNGSIMLAAHFLGKSWKDIMPILDRYLDDEGDFTVGGHRYSHIRDTLSHHISGIMENSRRIEAIINNLKDYVRKGKANLTIKTDVNSVVRISVSVLSSHIKRHTDHFNLELTEEMPRVNGNPQQLEQVVINLVMNALQAIAHKKQGVTVSTSIDKANSYVVVKVQDEGCGMSQEVKERIFEPFYSTKIDVGGTGLGLAISNFIVKEHKGLLEFESEPGRGTTATVKLPYADYAAADSRTGVATTRK